VKIFPAWAAHIYCYASVMSTFSALKKFQRRISVLSQMLPSFPFNEYPV